MENCILLSKRWNSLLKLSIFGCFQVGCFGCFSFYQFCSLSKSWCYIGNHCANFPWKLYYKQFRWDVFSFLFPLLTMINFYCPHCLVFFALLDPHFYHWLGRVAQNAPNYLKLPIQLIFPFCLLSFYGKWPKSWKKLMCRGCTFDFFFRPILVLGYSLKTAFFGLGHFWPL